jgi:hypothetical protein
VYICNAVKAMNKTENNAPSPLLRAGGLNCKSSNERGEGAVLVL